MKQTILSTVAVATSIIIVAAPAAAQSPSIGVDLYASSLFPAPDLAMDDLQGFGARLTYAPSSFLKFGLGATHFGTNRTAGDGGHRRDYTMSAPIADVEATIFGRDNRFYAALSPSLMMARAHATDGRAEERITIPAVGAGIGASFNVFGPATVDVSARDWMSWSRPLALSGVPQDSREWRHNIELRLSVGLKFQRRDQVARFEDLPLDFEGGFRPVRAGEIQSDHLRETRGREHEHTSRGTERVLDRPQYEIRAEEDLLLGTVYFEAGSFEVDRSFQRVVANIADHMRLNPDVRVRIRGFASPSDDHHRSLSLSERRANRIRYQLVYFYDIAHNRIEATTGGIDPESSRGDARRAEIIEVRERRSPVR